MIHHVYCNVLLYTLLLRVLKDWWELTVIDPLMKNFFYVHTCTFISTKLIKGQPVFRRSCHMFGSLNPNVFSVLISPVKLLFELFWRPHAA